MVCKDDKTKVAEILRAIDERKKSVVDRGLDLNITTSYIQGLEEAMQIIMRLR